MLGNKKKLEQATITMENQEEEISTLIAKKQELEAKNRSLESKNSQMVKQMRDGEEKLRSVKLEKDRLQATLDSTTVQLNLAKEKNSEYETQLNTMLKEHEAQLSAEKEKSESAIAENQKLHLELSNLQQLLEKYKEILTNPSQSTTWNLESSLQNCIKNREELFQSYLDKQTGVIQGLAEMFLTRDFATATERNSAFEELDITNEPAFFLSRKRELNIWNKENANGYSEIITDDLISYFLIEDVIKKLEASGLEIAIKIQYNFSDFYGEQSINSDRGTEELSITEKRSGFRTWFRHSKICCRYEKYYEFMPGAGGEIFFECKSKKFMDTENQIRELDPLFREDIEKCSLVIRRVK